ncbi:putative enzyme structurally related to dihydroxyacetone/glyceraldehyde kinase [Tepidibacter aestuarii]|nr:putative enzyme structurally related to dihydroxyacetone/glyceraldehyde kinase [Tepidibacter aestuarii]
MKVEYINAKLFRQMVLSGANNLQNHKELVDKLNVFPVPDGDTGTNMSLTIQAAVNEVIKDSNNTIKEIGKAASKGSLMGARGNSGVILSQLLRGFAKSIEDKDELDTTDLANALKNGADTAYKAVIKPIEGTILTVARETGEFAVKIAQKEKDMKKFMEKVLKESNRSLENTPNLLKNLKEAGVVDSGGKGLVCILEGAYKAFLGEFVEKNTGSNEVQEVSKNSEISTEDIKFAYCTEFILDTDKISYSKMKDLIQGQGDSLIVVGDDSLIKVHIHTNNPGFVLQEATKYGQLDKIKIENMRIQHENILIKEDIKEEPKEMKEYGFISIAMGSGITSIFKDFGVDHVIEGGQTMNPSTEDFIQAIDNINAKNIIILPNNSNVIMAANQAKEISDKNIIVIPSKTTPQGFSALLAFNPEADSESNQKAMKYALENVKTGQITFAVRDTSMNDIDIKEGDIIGIGEGKIQEAGKNIKEVTLSLIDKLVDEDSEIITLFYGEELSEDDTNELREEIEAKYDDLDVEVYCGNQPLYYYIISVE